MSSAILIVLAFFFVLLLFNKWTGVSKDRFIDKAPAAWLNWPTWSSL